MPKTRKSGPAAAQAFVVAVTSNSECSESVQSEAPPTEALVSAAPDKDAIRDELKHNEKMIDVYNKLINRLTGDLRSKQNLPLPEKQSEQTPLLDKQNDLIEKAIPLIDNTQKLYAALMEPSAQPTDYQYRYFETESIHLNTLLFLFERLNTNENLRHPRSQDLDLESSRRQLKNELASYQKQLPVAIRASQVLDKLRTTIGALEKLRAHADPDYLQRLKNQYAHHREHSVISPDIIRANAVFNRFNLLDLEYIHGSDPAAHTITCPTARVPSEAVADQLVETIVALTEMTNPPTKLPLDLLSELHTKLQDSRIYVQALQPLTPSMEEYRDAILTDIQYFMTLTETYITRGRASLDGTRHLGKTDTTVDYTFVPPHNLRPPSKTEAPSQQPMVKKIVRKKTAVTPSSPASSSNLTAPAKVSSPLPKPSVDYHKLSAQATTLLETLQSVRQEAEQRSAACEPPSNVHEFLEAKAKALDLLVLNLQSDTSFSHQQLIGQLHSEARSLMQLANRLLTTAYKNKQILNIPRLAWLLKNNEVTVQPAESGIREGSGNNASFLSVFYILDKHKNNRLWTAHFHYPAANSQPSEWRAGHLKRLDQDRHGLSYQQQQAQAGEKVMPIWRAHFDPATADLLFSRLSS
ncbi:hypothetical protein PS652_03563 [Pseudomonas fluorescens]